MDKQSLDHELYVNSAVPYPLPKSAWQRWRDWSGSNFIISIVLHIVVITVAALLVVQVMQPREKPKFKSAPPSPNPSSEHSVKAAKKSASMSQPTISKRITTTAANASVALPAMEMNSSMPDMMSSALSNLGASGLGAGASAGGVGALPPGGLTAFGFRGGKAGVIGHFYDLSQTKDKKPVSNFNYSNQIKEFQDRDWDESILKKYYSAPDSMSATQFYMPCNTSSGASKAFNVEKDAPDPKWVVYYKGTLIPKRDMELRFWATADDFLQIRINGNVVLPSKNINHAEVIKVFPDTPNPATGGNQGFYGEWFNLRLGDTYKIEILIGDSGGLYNQILLAEERNPARPYEMRIHEPKAIRLPLVQFRSGLPMPDYEPNRTVNYLNNPHTPLPYDRNPEPASEPLILQAR